MRIIGGELRGRRIEAPRGRGTRPMLDRVRESVFGALESRLGGLGGARVLDLFAGTGSLGLEALSRGAERARFVERGRGAAALLASNVASLGLGARAEIARANALVPSSWGEGPYEAVFLDPPYALLRDPDGRDDLLDALLRLADGRLSPGSVLVLHVPRHALDERSFPPTLRAERRTYGTSDVWLVARRD